jgi:hypothetical protein
MTMTDSHFTHATSETTIARRGRRAVLTAGATAAIGAVGVALADTADAAAGSPLLLGRSNSADSSPTAVSSTTTGTAFGVTATAGHGLVGVAKLSNKFGILGRNDATTAGAGGAVLADGKTNPGLVGRTANRNTYGIVALNTGTSLGDSGALVAEGGVNVGVVAFTDAPAGANSQPAIYGDGGVGAWASWLIGDVIVDGTVFAAVSLVGVRDPVNPIGYREAVSGEDAVHTQSGRATLDGTGGATVSVSPTFLDAADLAAATTSVQLTAMGSAMPNLAATITATGFTISGGTANGSVSWTVTAPRLAPGTTAAAAAAKASARRTSPAIRRTAAAPRRAPA